MEACVFKKGLCMNNGKAGGDEGETRAEVHWLDPDQTYIESNKREDVYIDKVQKIYSNLMKYSVLVAR